MLLGLCGGAPGPLCTLHAGHHLGVRILCWLGSLWGGIRGVGCASGRAEVVEGRYELSPLVHQMSLLSPKGAASSLVALETLV